MTLLATSLKIMNEKKASAFEIQYQSVFERCFHVKYCLVLKLITHLAFTTSLLTVFTLCSRWSIKQSKEMYWVYEISQWSSYFILYEKFSRLWKKWKDWIFSDCPFFIIFSKKNMHRCCSLKNTFWYSLLVATFHHFSDGCKFYKNFWLK